MARERVQISRYYVNYAKAVYDTFWTKMIEKQGRAPLSLTQLRAMVLAQIEVMVTENGDPATWTVCDHCVDGWYFAPATAEQARKDSNVLEGEMTNQGLCYQCKGKGLQSPADKRRNWGYQKRQAWEA